MKCNNCKCDNGSMKKTCSNCGSFLEGYCFNNVTGKYGYRGSNGLFYDSDIDFNKTKKSL